MSKENYLQFIASFLILLVLTIPFYTTSAYASINGLSVKGSDGIEGFAKQNDFLNFNAQVSISSDTAISNDQVFLGSSIQFERCTPSITNGSECTFRFPGNGTEAFEVKSLPFTVNLFKDDKTLDDSKSSSVIIDNKAPEVKLGVAQSKFSSQQNVVVNYEVKELSCDDPSCANKCVGIKNIEFATLDEAFKQKIDVTTNDCSVQSSLTIDPKIFNNGLNSIFARATDRFNQVSSVASVTFTVDASPPEILPNSFAVLSKGVSISAFSSAVIPVEVVVNISGNDLSFGSVTADLSALNPALPNLKNAKASCAAAGNSVAVCKWPIEYNPKTSGVKNVVINASDSLGNKASLILSKSFGIDNKAPVVQSLSTASVVDGKVFGKSSGNTVIAFFEESTGLSPSQTFLHVGSAKIPAATCSKEVFWTCIWNNVNFGAVSAEISVQSDTADVLGNSISGISSVGVIVDTNPPILKSINISPVGGITEAFPGFFKIGDKIAVVASLTEENDVIATADFSRFIAGASKVSGACERLQADEHVCTWLTNPINLETSDIITFNLSDNAGNTLIVTRSLKTFGLENATAPDFWDNTVTCSPKSIDRTLGPLINQRAFCTVSLKQKSATKPVSTVFIGQPSCSGDTSILQKVEAFNTEAGSSSPIIKFTLRRDEFKIDKASLSCSFSIFSKVGSSTAITKNPENEVAKIELQFSNLPLGELSQNVQDEIKQAKEDAEGIWSLISTLNKFIFYAKRICQIINMIYSILAILHNIVYILTGSEIVIEKIPLIGPLAKANLATASIGTCNTQTKFRVVAQETHKNIANKFCSYVNCKQAILWGPAVENWINSNANLLTPGSYVGGQYQIEKEGQGSGFGPLKTRDYVRDKKTGNLQAVGLGQPISSYMDPNKNIGVALLFACLPGIVYGLDKYRQILCLYADCLQNAVGKEGLPVTACKDQYHYARCKYLTTELFAVFPWTAVFDHFIGIIKNSMSNPFTAFGPLISFACSYTCDTFDAHSRLTLYGACETLKLFNQIGSVAQDFKSLIDDGFKIRQDYCERLEENDEDSKSSKK